MKVMILAMEFGTCLSEGNELLDEAYDRDQRDAMSCKSKASFATVIWRMAAPAEKLGKAKASNNFLPYLPKQIRGG